MEPMEQSIVRGTRATEARLRLSVLDLLTSHVNWAGIYFFRTIPDVEKIKAALARALDRFPSLAGGLVRADGDFYLQQNNAGVRFEVYRSREDCHDFTRDGPILDGSALIPADIPLQSLFDGGPFTTIRLTLFEQGVSTLAVRNVHTVDGPAFRHFMQCWSTFYTGGEYPPAQPFPREAIDELAAGNGHRPSAKFNVMPPFNFNIGREIAAHKPQYGAIDLYMANAGMEAVITLCKANTALPITSSDVVHALVWQAFSRCSALNNREYAKIYSIFDLRRVAGLGIAPHYDGNAVIERSARLKFSELRNVDLLHLVELYYQQVKPILEGEIRQDIAFLRQERTRGNCNPDNGRFTNFVRASLMDCLDGSGIYLNNLSMMEPNDIQFEGPAFWFEGMGILGLTTVFVYRTQDGGWAFRYIGKQNTLQPFCDHLKNLIYTYAADRGDVGDSESAHAQDENSAPGERLSRTGVAVAGPVAQRPAG